MTKISWKTFFIFFIFFTFSKFSVASVTPFEYYQRLIFLYLQVNNTDSLLFLLDTGANTSAIDSAAAEALQLKNCGSSADEGTAGTVTVQNVIVPLVKVGDKTIQELRMTKYSLANSLAPPGKKIDGILGTDFLKHFCVSIDFSQKELILSGHALAGNKAKSFPFIMDNGIPKIKTTLNKKVHTYLRYDSGSSLFETKDVYINITTAIWDELTKSDSTINTGKFLTATGIGGEIKLPLGKIKQIDLVNDNFKGNVYVICQPHQGYFSRADAVGFFGNNLFEKFHKIEIDFKAKRIYIPG